MWITKRIGHASAIILFIGGTQHRMKQAKCPRQRRILIQDSSHMKESTISVRALGNSTTGILSLSWLLLSAQGCTLLWALKRVVASFLSCGEGLILARVPLFRGSSLDKPQHRQDLRRAARGGAAALCIMGMRRSRPFMSAYSSFRQRLGCGARSVPTSHMFGDFSLIHDCFDFVARNGNENNTIVLHIVIN